MIISHKFRFIFIKTRKTAGTSIEVFLSRHCGEEDVLTPIFPHVEPHRAQHHRGLFNPIPELFMNKWSLGDLRSTARDLVKRTKFYNHIPAKFVQARVPKAIWDGYYRFCVERNPYDKTLSHFHMRNSLYGDNVSLDEYLRRGRLCVDHPRYTDNRGNLLVDRVLRYENLAVELGEVFGMLGIPFEGTLGVRAKSEFRQDRARYQDVLSGAQKAIIDKAFEWELGHLHYSY